MSKKEIKALLSVIDFEEPERNVPLDKFISKHSKKQIEFLTCPKNYILFYGGRRAGKTLAVTSMIYILDKTLPKKADIVVSSATVDKVRTLYWDNLININTKFKPKWIFKSGQNTIVTPYRQIYFHGLRDLNSATLPLGRGVGACIIEEGHTVRNSVLEYYCDVVIRGCFKQFPKSFKMIFALNPPVGRLEYLHKVYENPEYAKIQISSQDNPLPAIQKDFKAHLKSEAKVDGYKNLQEAMESPNFQRNVLGLWVYENNRLVVDVTKVDTFSGDPVGPKDELTTVLGVDFGGGEACHAIVALQYSKYSNKVYCVEEWLQKSKDRTLQELAESIIKMHKKYTYNGKKPVISVDKGGHGGVIAYELMRRYKTPPLITAKKRDKLDYLMLVQTEAHKKRLLFRDTGSLLMKEFPQIFFDEKFKDIDKENSIHSDLLDACVYAYRHIYNFLPEVRAKEKTQTQRMKERRIKAVQNQSDGRSIYRRLNKKYFLQEQ